MSFEEWVEAVVRTFIGGRSGSIEKQGGACRTSAAGARREESSMGHAEEKRAKIIAEQAAREAAQKAAQKASGKSESPRPVRRSWAGPPSSGFRPGPSRKRNEP
jgi:hypothetical protein